MNISSISSTSMIASDYENQIKLLQVQIKDLEKQALDENQSEDESKIKEDKIEQLQSQIQQLQLQIQQLESKYDKKTKEDTDDLNTKYLSQDKYSKNIMNIIAED